MKKINVNKLIIVLAIIISYIPVLLTSQDSDMFFLISSGKEILNGNFYTLSQFGNIPTIKQQWLYSIILTQFDKFNYIGDIVFVFLQNILLWIVSYIFIYRKTKDKFISIISPIILTILLESYLVNIRPQTITITLLVIELILLDLYKDTNKKFYLYIIIPLLLLAANIHLALFLYHIYVIIPYYMYNKKIDWVLILMTPVYLLCSICTPYTIKGSLYLYYTFKSNVFDSLRMSEIQPLSILSFIGILSLIICIITIYKIYKQDFDLYIIFFIFTPIVLNFISVRFCYLLYIGCLFLIPRIKIKSNIYFNGFILILCIIITMFRVNSIKNLDYTKIDSNMVCTKVVDYIPDKNAKIFNTINYGNYLEYIGYNNLTIDCRPELFTKEFCGKDIVSYYTTTTRGQKNNSNYINDINTYEETNNILKQYDYIVCSTNDIHIYRTLMHYSNDYNILYINDYYMIIERK